MFRAATMMHQQRAMTRAASAAVVASSAALSRSLCCVARPLLRAAAQGPPAAAAAVSAPLSTAAATAAAYVPFLSAREQAATPPSWSLQDYSSAARVPSSAATAPITAKELAHLAHPPYLSPSSEQADGLVRDLEGVVGWIGTITTLDMDQYEPMYSPLEIKEYYTTAMEAKNNTTASAGSAGASTANVATPASDLTDPASPESVHLRADVVTDGGIEKAVLANAAYKHRGFFVVPKVVDLEDS